MWQALWQIGRRLRVEKPTPPDDWVRDSCKAFERKHHLIIILVKQQGEASLSGDWQPLGRRRSRREFGSAQRGHKVGLYTVISLERPLNVLNIIYSIIGCASALCDSRQYLLNFRPLFELRDTIAHASLNTSKWVSCFFFLLLGERNFEALWLWIHESVPSITVELQMIHDECFS